MYLRASGMPHHQEGAYDARDPVASPTPPFCRIIVAPVLGIEDRTIERIKFIGGIRG